MTLDRPITGRLVLALLVTILGHASTLQACPPKKVILRSTVEAAAGSVGVSVIARAGRTSVEIEAVDLPAATSGAYAVSLRSEAGDHELARFQIDDPLHWNEFDVEKDLRSLLLETKSVVLVDGELSFEQTEFKRAAMVEILTERSRKGRRRSTSAPKEEAAYEIGGLVLHRHDGMTRHMLRARVRRAEPGKTLTFRLSGHDAPFDIEVRTNRRGDGKARALGKDEVAVEAAVAWSELVVLDGDTELARIPLICR